MWTIGDNRQRTCQGISRRGFLQIGFLGAIGASFPQLLAAQEAGKKEGRKPRSVILLWLWGGPSHLDTFDMKPDAPSEYRGPFRPIPTSVAGIQVCEYFPLLAKMADRYAVLRSLHHDTNDHGIAGTVCLTGKEAVAGRVMPTMGAVAARVRGQKPPFSSFVAIGAGLQQGHRPVIGQGGGILGSSYDPFRLVCDEAQGVQIHDLKPPEEITSARLDRRRMFLKVVEQAQKHLESSREVRAQRDAMNQAFALIADSGARAVFELEREPEPLRDRYGRFRFGQSCLLARRLVEAGVPFVQVNWSTHVEAEEDYGDGGWDLHYRNFEITADRHMWMLDQSMSALLEDLHQRGMLEDTLVLAIGEFGRTPKINDKAGRDHWNQCYSALIAGGGIRGGQVVGASDARGEFPAVRPLTPADVCMTVYDRLGIPRTKLLELEIAPEGQVIEELV